ncbi:MAG: hypothetical protein R2819_12150 [Allomuricauda sp.]
MEEDKRTFLPYGDSLRVLIAHSELSVSNHKSLLKNKGVFLGDYEKNTTVPTLMKLILDPSEFQELVEMQSSKEDNEKYRTLKLPWKNDVDLFEAIPKDFNINKIIKESTAYKPTFKVLGSPQFKKIDGNSNRVELEYIIERENNTKGWDERKTRHKGSLILEKTASDNIQLVLTKTHTAKETNELGENILKNLKSHFKDNGYVRNEDDFERIQFNHFLNENRIQFLFGFTDAFHGSMDFVKLTDLTVGPDLKEDPPKEIKDFLDGINKLRIQGEALQRHMLISKKEYHSKIVFSSLTIRYKFKLSEGNGSCVVEFVFSDYEDKQNEKAEFQFYIQSITLDKGYRQHANQQKIRKKLNKAIEGQKLFLYEKHKI